MHRSICRFIALTVALAVMAVPAWGAEEIKTLAIGAKAPGFALPGVDGQVHKLSDYDQAKVLVIVFTCNHCPTAQAYEGRIKKRGRLQRQGCGPGGDLAERSRGGAARRIGLYRRGRFARRHEDPRQGRPVQLPLSLRWAGPEGLKGLWPGDYATRFVFDSERKLRFAGRVDNNERNPDKATSHDTRDAIEAVLAGKPVAVETTRTMGCSIKWSDKRDSVKQAFETWAKEPVGIEEIDLDGVKTLVKNDTGKLRLINIWSTACGPCIVEFPEFVTMNRMYRAANSRWWR
jgi:hypothetical protein